VSIRFQLLLIALSTLVLPWAGCQYARELESALRVSQESSLQASAETISNALAAQAANVFDAPGAAPQFDWTQGDLYLVPLHQDPLLDGYREDWGDLAAAPRTLPTRTGLAARLLGGSTDHYAFLYVEVDDPSIDSEPSDPHPDTDRFDRINLEIQSADGTIESYFFATDAPGLIAAQTLVHDEAGAAHVALEPRIQAYWQQTSRGYHLEARMPRSLLATRLWIQVIDGGSGRRAGSSSVEYPAGGKLFFTTPGLNHLLSTFLSPGTRVTVIDTNGLKLGVAGSLRVNPDADLEPTGGSWYRRFVAGDLKHWPLQVVANDHVEGRSVSAALAGHPAAEWLRSRTGQTPLLIAAAPIQVGAWLRGAVVLEQAGDQLLELRDRALTHLFNFTLLATVLAALIAFGVATWISLRIGRLRHAAEAAVGPDGRIRLDMPEAHRGDEIGALARGFERLLGRLHEHTHYLRTLGGKLSHELRTPLTIVRSSLDNLESEGVRPDQAGYLTRAREGVLRLQSTLSALGAAARVEESIRQTDRITVDLADLLESAVAGYRDGFPTARFELLRPAGECFMPAAPDLIVQMLDKLIENAVDFCAVSGTISVRLRRTETRYQLSVSNDGPPIPPEMLDRLFESLFEHRRGGDDRPHFGLGLYIVRLIAEFHGGEAVAANRPDGAGAMFTVILPMV
jgi:dedicated sortase system histidine kinase